MAAARSKNTDRLAWFKWDAGRFGTDTAGFSLQQSGAYIQLMNLYWIMGNCLPTGEAGIMRRVGAVTPEDIQTVREILEEFFPLNSEGKHCHALLEQRLADVQERSEKAKASANARYGKPSAPAEKESDPTDF